MSSAHHLAGWLVVASTAALLGAAAWSWLTGRRSGGRVDHRFAVDRLVLVSLAAIAVAVVLGLVVLAGGGRPADPLHLLYGVLACVALPAGWALAGRAGAGSGVTRRGRDAWLTVAAAVLLGIELRLFLTG